jgi:hypothetical protein
MEQRMCSARCMQKHRSSCKGLLSSDIGQNLNKLSRFYENSSIKGFIKNIRIGSQQAGRQTDRQTWPKLIGVFLQMF